MSPLGSLAGWPGRHGACLLRAEQGRVVQVAAAGDLDRRFPHASVTKVATALAVLGEVAAASCSLEDRVGPPGVTLAHLLAHAAGLPLDGEAPIAPAGTRRIYSNSGIELAAAHAASAAGVSVAALVGAVFERLGMHDTELAGGAAAGAVGTTRDLARLAAELLVPSLVPDPLARRARTVVFPGLVGVLPGYGRHEPCDWGLGVEVKGTKRRHWTGARWPTTTFGHFGQLGGFVAVDPDAGVALVTLGDAPFGPWAIEAWPAFTDAAHAAA